MNAETKTRLTPQMLLRNAKQCAALTGCIRVSRDDFENDEAIAELATLAYDLASGMHLYFLHSTAASNTEGRAFGVSGKLYSTLAAIDEIAGPDTTASGQREYETVACRVGWLQNAADDLAKELLGLVRELQAEGGAA